MRRGPDLLVNRNDGTLYRGDLRLPVASIVPYNRHPGTFDYTVVSAAVPDGTQPGESKPYRREIESKLLTVPSALEDRLRPIAAPLVGGLDPADLRGRARALEAYLRDSGRFGYTLRVEAVDRTLDPIADFLINRKRGHCEYFASALTILQRTAGVPARIINEFKGGDWNGLGQVLAVRQKHAHSWVEALIGQTREGRPIWMTLDPTPAEERDQQVARVGGLAARLRFVSDYLRYLWVFYIVGFDTERQKRLIYHPIKLLVQEAGRGFTLMDASVRAAAHRPLVLPKLAWLFSLRGLFVSSFALLLLVGLARALAWPGRRLLRRFRPASDAGTDLASGMASYRRLVQILAGIGLRRPPAETPREFARRSAEVLMARGPEARDLADVPALVVDTSYLLRFGGHPPTPEALQHVEALLDALEAALRPTP